jgi:hypothetical protein
MVVEPTKMEKWWLNQHKLENNGGLTKKNCGLTNKKCGLTNKKIGDSW